LKTVILTFKVAWAGHVQHMTNPCKNVIIAPLADFGVYLWRKIEPQSSLCTRFIILSIS